MSVEILVYTKCPSLCFIYYYWYYYYQSVLLLYSMVPAIHFEGYINKRKQHVITPLKCQSMCFNILSPFTLTPFSHIVSLSYPFHLTLFFFQHQSVIPRSLHLVTPVNSCPTHMLPLNPLLRSTPYHHPPLSLFAPTLIPSTSPTLPFLHLPLSHLPGFPFSSSSIMWGHVCTYSIWASAHVSSFVLMSTWAADRTHSLWL